MPRRAHNIKKSFVLRLRVSGLAFRVSCSDRTPPFTFHPPPFTLRTIDGLAGALGPCFSVLPTRAPLVPFCNSHFISSHLPQLSAHSPYRDNVTIIPCSSNRSDLPPNCHHLITWRSKLDVAAHLAHISLLHIACCNKAFNIYY